MEQEELLLYADILETRAKAWKAERSLSHEYESQTAETVNKYDERRHELETTFEFYIKKLYRDVGILAERMRLPHIRRELSNELRSCKDITNMEIEPGDIGLHSPMLASVSQYLASLEALFDASVVPGLHVFRTILSNTAAIIRDAGAEPQNEADVRHAVFKILQYAFHDVVRDPPIRQIFKTYKPDFGVRSLKAAAEYKFATSEDELKKSLDEIYADMKGYSGHEFRTFYAVIYTTDAIAHKDKLEAEFRRVKADANWEAILIVGQGERKKKQSAAIEKVRAHH